MQNDGAPPVAGVQSILEPTGGDSAAGKSRRVGRRRRLINDIKAWIGNRQAFSFEEARAAFPQEKDVEFGPALNKARHEITRDEGIVYGTDAADPGVLRVIRDDGRKVRRSGRFVNRAISTIRHAADTAISANPENLSPVQKTYRERVELRAGSLEAAARKRSRKRLPGC